MSFSASNNYGICLSGSDVILYNMCVYVAKTIENLMVCLGFTFEVLGSFLGEGWVIRLNYVSCTVKLSHIACGAKRQYIGEVKKNITVNFLICLW
jgi:hypothetical protein